MGYKIAFTGKKGSGKTTTAFLLAEHIKKCSKKEVHNLSFATPIKKCESFIQQTFGLQECKDRELLQMLGTFGREKNKDLFVNILEKRIIDLLYNDPNEHIIIDDVRFVNEAIMLGHFGFTIIKLDNREAEKIIDNHESEIPLPPSFINHVITNNESVEKLRYNVVKLFNTSLV